MKIQVTRYKIQEDLVRLIRDELNVKEVIFVKSAKDELVLDTKITLELKKEGLLREMLRHIQGMRKQAGYKPKDRVQLSYSGEQQLKEILEENRKMVMSAVGLKEMTEAKDGQKFDVEQEVSLEVQTLWFGIKK